MAKSETSGVVRNDPFVEIVKDDGRWHWILWAQNGRPVAMSAIDYSRSNDAVSGFETAAKLMDEPQRIKFLVSKKVVHKAGEHEHPKRKTKPS